MLRVGKELMDAKKLDEYSESPDVSVYEFVAKQPSNLSYVAVKELTSKFKIFRGEEEWINEKWLGRSLKRLNLVLQDKRMASGKYVMLNIVKAKDKLQMFSLGKEE